jgi:hypothetical protein
MRSNSYACLFLLSSVLLVGCVAPPKYVIRTDPSVMSASNDVFDASVAPRCRSDGCQGFSLSIRNKTDKTIEVNWNKTLYIRQGQSAGGFMFEGIVYRDRNSPKSPDVVFGKGSFTKIIWPNTLVEFHSGRYGGWHHESMPNGENGVYLTVNIDGKEMSEKLVTNISSSPVSR